MKKIFYILIVLTTLSCSNGRETNSTIKNSEKNESVSTDILANKNDKKNIEKLISNAKSLDSIKIVSPNAYAEEKDLQIIGHTLSEIESLYGDYEINSYRCYFKDIKDESVDESDIQILLLSGFKSSDFPLTVYGYDWIRNKRTRDLVKTSSDVWNLSSHEDDLGMCLRVYFVKNDSSLIAYRALQTKCKYLFFLE